MRRSERRRERLHRLHIAGPRLRAGTRRAEHLQESRVHRQPNRVAEHDESHACAAGAVREHVPILRQGRVEHAEYLRDGCCARESWHRVSGMALRSCYMVFLVF